MRNDNQQFFYRWFVGSTRALFMFAFLLPFLSQQSFSSSFSSRQCFAEAENYYEQVYCEVKAKRPLINLPSFFEFKKNTEQVQALLLKPHAAKFGIQLKMPQKRMVSKKNVSKPPKAQVVRQADHAPSKQPSDACAVTPEQIDCDDGSYSLLTNRALRDLDDRVLDRGNLLGLSAFTGSYDDANAAAVYLGKAYEQYLNKMVEIGLGASTLSYAKFHFLFYDLHEKQVDFVARFEKMFFYLKKDRQNSGVKTAKQLPSELVWSGCDALVNFIACNVAGRNYLYQKVK